MKKKPNGFIPIDMGPIPVWLFLATDEESFYRGVEGLGLVPAGPFIAPDKAASAQFLDKPKDGMVTLVACFNKPKKLTASFAALVSHEAVHISDFCWEVMGEDKPGEEVRAYMVQYLTQRFLDGLLGVAA